MSPRFNSATVIVSGNLVVDVKNISGEGKLPCFVTRVAVDVSKKVSEGNYEKVRTDFFDVKSFDESLAKFATGAPVTITGDLITNQDKDKDGNPRVVVQVLARTVEAYVFPAKASAPAGEPVPA